MSSTNQPRPAWWVEVLHRVIVEPVRSGALRFTGWTPQLAAMGVVAAITGLTCLVLITFASVFRSRFSLHEWAGISMPLALFGVIIVLTAITVTYLLTGLMHSAWPLRVASILLAIGCFATAGFTVFIWHRDVRAWAILAAMVGFAVLAIVRREAAWWEPAAVLAIVSLGIVAPLLLVGNPATEFPALGLLTPLLGAAAAAPTMIVGVAASEVALSTAVWAGELGSDRLATRTARWAPVVISLVVTGTAVVIVLRDPSAALRVLAGGGLVVLSLLASFAARRGVDTMGVAALPDVARRLVWVVAGVMGGGFFLSLFLNVMSSWMLLWFQIEVPQLADVLINKTGAWMRLLGALVSVIFLINAWRRRDRKLVVVSTALAAILTLGGGAGFGWWHRLWNQAGVATIMAVVTTLIVVVGALRVARPRQASQALAMAGLCLGVALPDLLGDPVAVALGATGAGAVIFGLIWNLLTSADFANHDSRRFPRQARVLLLLGLVLVTLLHIVLASVVQTGVLGAILDIVTTIGTVEIGTALLVAAWAVLAVDHVLPSDAVPDPAVVEHPVEAVQSPE